MIGSYLQICGVPMFELSIMFTPAQLAARPHPRVVGLIFWLGHFHVEHGTANSKITQYYVDITITDVTQYYFNTVFKLLDHLNDNVSFVQLISENSLPLVFSIWAPVHLKRRWEPSKSTLPIPKTEPVFQGCGVQEWSRVSTGSSQSPGVGRSPCAEVSVRSD